eukprot:gnl/Dysnectes_brevis/3168_a3951_1204.p1 GENE.gnl/Dysnectes_brevis/3168_a3951_1204~~gnl/Dysnectes_brevis/3168_a3951_1204.p1  ORF type:complete len:317 (-),score=29.77 gnl/Dysnectes_brevis/3168_a3951_1204:77-1027(-)
MDSDESRNILSLDPSEGVFEDDVCTFRLTNLTEHHIAFKVLCTRPKQFTIYPSKGFIRPNDQLSIEVTSRTSSSSMHHHLQQLKPARCKLIAITTSADHSSDPLQALKSGHKSQSRHEFKFTAKHDHQVSHPLSSLSHFSPMSTLTMETRSVYRDEISSMSHYIDLPKEGFEGQLTVTAPSQPCLSCERLREQLEAAEERVDDLQASLVEVQASLAAAEQVSGSLQTDISTYQEKEATLEVSLSAARTSGAQYEAKCGALISQMSELEAQMKDTESELKSLEDKQTPVLTGHRFSLLHFLILSLILVIALQVGQRV